MRDAITTRLIQLTLLLAFPLASGCGAFDFDLDQPIDEVVIPGADRGLGSGAQLPVNIIPPQNWNTDLTQEPAGIFLESMSLQVTDTARDGEMPPDSLAFIDAVVFYAEPSTPGSALERVPVAWTEAPGEVQDVELTVNRALNLVEYIKEGFTISSDLAGKVPRTDVSIQGNLVLGVDVF